MPYILKEINEFNKFYHLSPQIDYLRKLKVLTLTLVYDYVGMYDILSLCSTIACLNLLIHTIVFVSFKIYEKKIRKKHFKRKFIALLQKDERVIL